MIEGCVTEYIAYRQGLPVTKSLVQRYVTDMGVDEELGEMKSLGNVVFECKDKSYATGLDLSTLCRHFDLIDDLWKDGMLKQDNEGNIVIPIDFPYDDVWSAIRGISRRARNLVNLTIFPYYCLRFLRPKDSSYYMRYYWHLYKNQLRIDKDVELSEAGTVSFMLDVSRGLDEDTRAHLSKYSSMVGPLLGPLVTHLHRWVQEYVDWVNLRILLVDRPSAYFYLVCLAHPKRERIIEELEHLRFTDNGEGLTHKEWEKIQQEVFTHMWWMRDNDTLIYRYVAAILGWINLEDFPCPIFNEFYDPSIIAQEWKKELQSSV